MSNYSSRRSTKSKIQRVLKRPIKRLLNRISAKSAKFKKFYSKFKVSNRERRYDRHAGLPTKDKMVVFESFMGRKYADSPKAIYEFMLDNHNFDDYEFIWCFKDRCIDEYSFIEKNNSCGNNGSDINGNVQKACKETAGSGAIEQCVRKKR